MTPFKNVGSHLSRKEIQWNINIARFNRIVAVDDLSLPRVPSEGSRGLCPLAAYCHLVAKQGQGRILSPCCHPREGHLTVTLLPNKGKWRSLKPYQGHHDLSILTLPVTTRQDKIKTCHFANLFVVFSILVICILVSICRRCVLPRPWQR